MSTIDLTPRQRKTVQFIAATSNVLLKKTTIGVSIDRLKKQLGVKSDKEVEDNVEIFNLALQEEVVPTKIIYDDVLKKYVYLQTADPSVVMARLNTKSLLLLMLIFYNEKVLNLQYTHMDELQSTIDATVTENNISKIKIHLDPLLKYCLITEENSKYRVTKVGESFLTPILLNRVTNVIMGKNYSIDAVLEFFGRI